MSEIESAQSLAAPLQAEIVEDRSWLRQLPLLSLACLAVVALSLVLNPAHPTGPVELCPMMRVTHLPCPGCGITRAMVHCGHGDFRAAFRYHPLGPPMWLAVLLGASSLLWPRRLRDRVVAFWRRHQVRIDALILGGTALLTVFGVLRILFHFLPPPSWWPWGVVH